VYALKYVCEICGYVYDEEAGLKEQNIAPGTKFEELPDDFVCPECGVGKTMFDVEE
jgi:rubredoxin